MHDNSLLELLITLPALVASLLTADAVGSDDDKPIRSSLKEPLRIRLHMMVAERLSWIDDVKQHAESRWSH
jgi:hypothetical protein